MTPGRYRLSFRGPDPMTITFPLRTVLAEALKGGFYEVLAVFGYDGGEPEGFIGTAKA